MNLSHVMRTYYRCEIFVRVLHRSEGFARICHICQNFALILYRCDKYARIFHTRLTFTFERICHTCEEFARNCYICEKFERILLRCTNMCEFFTRLKLDICEKLVSILKNLKIGRTYISHISKCDVFVRIIHSVWNIRNVNVKVQQPHWLK